MLIISYNLLFYLEKQDITCIFAPSNVKMRNCENHHGDRP